MAGRVFCALLHDGSFADDWAITANAGSIVIVFASE